VDRGAWDCRLDFEADRLRTRSDRVRCASALGGEGDLIIRQIVLAVAIATVSASVNRPPRTSIQAINVCASSSRDLSRSCAATVASIPGSRFFSMRQVDCNVLSLRVALQHALERELATNTAFLVATVGVTRTLA
jgi:hypothetical protein